MNDLKLFAKCYVEVHDLSIEDKKKLFEFIDVAKDYEVMNLLTTGEIVSLEEEHRDKIVEKFKQTMAYPVILLGEQFTTTTGTQMAKRAVKAVTKTAKAVAQRVSQIEPTTVKPQAQISGIHVPDTVSRFFWNLAQKTTGKQPFTSVKGVELWLSKADVNQVASMASKLMRAVGEVGAATLAAVFLFLAIKVLKSKLSAAQRACKNLPSDKKKDCIRKFKVDAIKNQISILQKGLTACSNSKDPDKCKRTIQKKIDKLKMKLQKVK